MWMGSAPMCCSTSASMPSGAGQRHEAWQRGLLLQPHHVQLLEDIGRVRDELGAVLHQPVCEPRLVGEKMLPGTAKTSRPWSRAKRTVCMTPLSIGASTTRTPSDSPLRSRFRRGKFRESGRVPRGYSESSAPDIGDSLRQLLVVRGIDDVDAGAHDGEGAPARVQRGGVRYGVDAARQPANDGNARRRQVADQRMAGLASVGRGAARAHDGDAAHVLGRENRPSRKALAEGRRSP